MTGLVCALLEPPGGVPRARDLTVSWLRWGYFGDILEGSSVDALLARAAEAGYEHCLIQAWGHVVSEHASPNGGRSVSFFDALRDWTARHELLAAGVRDRVLLVDVRAWQAGGRPPYAEMPVAPFGPELAAHLVDLKSDLRDGAPFLAAVDELCAKATRGVFVLNYEPYADVERPPDGFVPPFSPFYGVAAGLKPNRILETHRFDARTKVVFFDYSAQALAFRRLLRDEWDGRDYPRFLRGVFARIPSSGTHYYLWPGASPEDLDWREMERLWAAETARWGGEEALARHWTRFRELACDFLHVNVLTESERLLDAVEDAESAVIWWSNVFATVFSAAHYTLEEKRALYERFVRALAERAPRLWLYGSDHSNSSVNGLTAAEYWEGYCVVGGDPLRGRRLHRQAIRF